MAITYDGATCNFVLSDLPNTKVNSERLTKEINESAIVPGIETINTTGSDVVVILKDNFSGNDQTIMTAIIGAHSGEPLNTHKDLKFDAFGNAIFVSAGAGGIKETYISFNWGDKHTWYHNAVKVENGVMVDSGDHITYELTTPTLLIDVTHWRLSDESWNPDIKKCKPVVKVDNVAYVENYVKGNTVQHPSNGYDINYVTGDVIFNNALAGTEEVTITYYKLPVTDENNEYGMRQSCFVLKAPTGWRVTLNRAEIQWEKNINLLDRVRFIPYYEVGKNPVMDANLTLLGLGALPNGYELPIPWLATLDPSLSDYAKYEKAFNTVFDFTDDADGYYEVTKHPSPVYVTDSLGRFNSTGTIRPMSRDLLEDVRVKKWIYQGGENMTLDSSKGLYIKLFLQDDTAFINGRATATLYGTKYAIED